jgi:hypothetical protein
MKRTIALLWLLAGAGFGQPPHPIPNGFSLPNGWRITPAGMAEWTEDK